MKSLPLLLLAATALAHAQSDRVIKFGDITVKDFVGPRAMEISGSSEKVLIDNFSNFTSDDYYSLTYHTADDESFVMKSSKGQLKFGFPNGCSKYSSIMLSYSQNSFRGVKSFEASISGFFHDFMIKGENRWELRDKCRLFVEFKNLKGEVLRRNIESTDSAISSNEFFKMDLSPEKPMETPILFESKKMMEYRGIETQSLVLIPATDQILSVKIPDSDINRKLKFQGISPFLPQKVEFFTNGKLQKIVADEEVEIQGFNLLPRKEIQFYESGKIHSGSIAEPVVEVNGVKLQGFEPVIFNEEGYIESAQLAEETIIKDANKELCFKKDTQVILNKNGTIRTGILCQGHNSYRGLILDESSGIVLHESGEVMTAGLKGNQKIRVPGVGEVEASGSVAFHENGQLASLIPNSNYTLSNGVVVRSSKMPIEFHKNGNLKKVYLYRTLHHSSGAKFEDQVSYYSNGNIEWTVLSKDSIFSQNGYTCQSPKNTAFRLHENGEVKKCTGTYLLNKVTLTTPAKYDAILGHTNGMIGLANVKESSVIQEVTVRGLVTFHANGNLRSGDVTKLSKKDGFSLLGKAYFWSNGKLAYAISSAPQKINGKWYMEGDKMIFGPQGEAISFEKLQSEFPKDWALRETVVNETDVLKLLEEWEIGTQE